MSNAVCPVNRLTHDWNNGLACRWCDATRTSGEAIVSGLASRRGGTEDSARALLDAYRAEVLAEAAAAPEPPVWLGTPVVCPHCTCEQTHCNGCGFDMYDPPIGGGA